MDRLRYGTHIVFRTIDIDLELCKKIPLRKIPERDVLSRGILDALFNSIFHKGERFPVRLDLTEKPMAISGYAADFLGDASTRRVPYVHDIAEV